MPGVKVQIKPITTILRDTEIVFRQTTYKLNLAYQGQEE